MSTDHMRPSREAYLSHVRLNADRFITPLTAPIRPGKVLQATVLNNFNRWSLPALLCSVASPVVNALLFLPWLACMVATELLDLLSELPAALCQRYVKAWAVACAARDYDRGEKS